MKNKIILFALVAVHAYSEKCGINYVEVGAERVFLDLMQDSFTLLKNTGRIELSSFDSIFTIVESFQFVLPITFSLL